MNSPGNSGCGRSKKLFPVRHKARSVSRSVRSVARSGTAIVVKSLVRRKVRRRRTLQVRALPVAVLAEPQPTRSPS